MYLRTRDAARCAEISPYVVREYSDAGLIASARDAGNNYRWIDMRAVPQVHLWQTLQRLGYSMGRLREIGRNRSPENALELFESSDAQLETMVSQLRARQDMLRSYCALIREGLEAQPGAIEVRALPARPVNCAPLAGGGFEPLCGTLGQIGRQGNGSCPLGLAYGNFNSLLNYPEHPAQLVSFDPRGADVRPAGEYLVGTEQCGYGEMGELARRMDCYARQRGLAFRGPAYAVYLFDEACVANPENCLLQIAVEVKQTA